jgi:riboflavin synthase alpha subunit
VRRFGYRLSGERGEGAVILAGQAARAVALGVGVTAIVQSILGGIGLAIAGVPFAPVLTAVMFMFCIAQLGPTLVLAPAVVWLYWGDNTGWGTFLLIWTVFVGTMDNFLRPVLIKQGADLPLLLILAGVIGGMLAFGLVGLFVGPVILAVGYTLLEAWINEATPRDRDGSVRRKSAMFPQPIARHQPEAAVGRPQCNRKPARTHLRGPDMFSGIIAAVGQITCITARDDGAGNRSPDDRRRQLGLDDVGLGDSIACNGVCLTVVDRRDNCFCVDVSPESLACTVGLATPGPVNLEKALRLADRLGGHLVSGHVDGVGEVLRFDPVGDNRLLEIRAPAALARYIARKGSITVDGVSLTTNSVDGAAFSINLIPHTLDATTLGGCRPAAGSTSRST